jgi:hypothetical protein
MLTATLNDAIAGLRTNELAVLSVLVEHQLPSGAVTLGCRRTAEPIGLSKDVAARALRKLEKLSLIFEIPTMTGIPVHAMSWRLAPGIHMPLMMRGIWSKHGFGPDAERIYNALPVGIPLGYKVIKQFTGLSHYRVRNALMRLHSSGLVNPTKLNEGKPVRGTEWIKSESSEDYLSVLATTLQIEQRSAGKKRQHNHQRWEWHLQNPLRGSDVGKSDAYEKKIDKKHGLP